MSQHTNPIFNDNKLKLGMFGLNSGNQIMTLAPERYVADWKRSDECMRLADAAGLEAMVSLMGWQTRQFEPFTWATALGARHPTPAVVATFHAQLMHPTFVAKAAATGDHVTAGRFGINVVAGSSPRAYQAFGQELEDHGTRYDHAAEFMDLLHRLWREEAFDFEGRFYTVKRNESLPKPLQAFPPIMNAGTSERGLRFAARYADMVFTHLQEDLDGVRSLTASCKKLAFEEFGRTVQVWTHGYIVLRDTADDAEEFLRYYAEQHADQTRIEAWVKALGEAAPDTMPPADRWKYQRNWAAGGGVALVGTAEQVAARLCELSAAGLDGILFNSIEPEGMLERLTRDLLPRLEQAGLRRPKRS